MAFTLGKMMCCLYVSMLASFMDRACMYCLRIFHHMSITPLCAIAAPGRWTVATKSGALADVAYGVSFVASHLAWRSSVSISSWGHTPQRELLHSEFYCFAYSGATSEGCFMSACDAPVAVSQNRSSCYGMSASFESHAVTGDLTALPMLMFFFFRLS